MNRRRIFVLLVASVLGACAVVWFSLDSGDHFPINLDMKSERGSYVLGDEIRLVATMTPTRPTRIRVYRERHKSLCVLLRRVTDDAVDYSDNDFWRCTDPLEADSIDAITISPEQPLVVEIEGRVLARPNGGVLFDLGQFGSFEKVGGSKFLIGGFWRPINPAPSDSLEYYTNKILINVERPVASFNQPSNVALEWTWPSSSAAELK